MKNQPLDRRSFLDAAAMFAGSSFLGSAAAQSTEHCTTRDRVFHTSENALACWFELWIADSHPAPKYRCKQSACTAREE